ncbi:B3 domain-containing protein Os03g0212300 [Linum perenne]
MSSSRTQSRGKQPTNNNQRAQCPSHFFRLIVDEEEHSKMLPLPKKFASHFRGTTATLQTPPGDQWTVAISNDDDGTKQFSGQWNDFYTFNSLKLGHFLLFKDNGNNHFSVAIFDTSTCEIEYPNRNPEIFNNQSANNETTQTATADTSHTNYPFFKLDLSRCAATATQIVRIPASFTEAHPILKKAKTVLLQHDGRSWKTKAYLQEKKYISIAWVEFAAENSITNNHVCYFELLPTTSPIRFKVTIS